MLSVSRQRQATARMTPQAAAFVAAHKAKFREHVEKEKRLSSLNRRPKGTVEPREDA